jgi:hypothetical protein
VAFLQPFDFFGVSLSWCGAGLRYCAMKKGLENPIGASR